MHINVAGEAWHCLLDASEVLGGQRRLLEYVGPIYIIGTTKLRALVEEDFKNPFLPNAIGNFEARINFPAGFQIFTSWFLWISWISQSYAEWGKLIKLRPTKLPR